MPHEIHIKVNFTSQTTCDAEIYKLTGKEGDAESTKSETVELIHPNEVLKALRTFVDDHRKPQK